MSFTNEKTVRKLDPIDVVFDTTAKASPVAINIALSLFFYNNFVDHQTAAYRHGSWALFTHIFWRADCNP